MTIAFIERCHAQPREPQAQHSKLARMMMRLASAAPCDSRLKPRVPNAEMIFFRAAKAESDDAISVIVFDDRDRNILVRRRVIRRDDSR